MTRVAGWAFVACGAVCCAAFYLLWHRHGICVSHVRCDVLDRRFGLFQAALGGTVLPFIGLMLLTPPPQH